MGRTRVVLLAFVVALVCGLWSAAAARAQEPGTLENVLVFSKTGGFRHDSIPQGITAIQQLGTANGFTVTATEDAAAFTDANLANFDVVVFLSTTGEVLDDTQQAAFERFIQAGGGYAGIHAASDTEYSWPWYGELVGGYFRTHPPGTPTATVDIEDADEPSTTGLPASWTRVDEWYNFQHPTTPAVNGSSTIADFSPRARHVKVLATVDESTYGEEDGNTADDDHPVAWCSRFDGGISWYTAMGHTQASFADAEFRAHLLGGLRTAAGVAGDCGEPRSMPPTAEDFEKVTLDDETKAPMEIAIAEDGRVFYIELGQPVTGGQANQASAELMVWDPDTQSPSVAGTLTVDNSHENGLLGVTLAPDFAVTGHLYMSYSKLGPEPVTAKVNRLSRFTIGADNQIVAGSEVPIYEWTHQRAGVLPHRRLARLRARRQPLHLHGRQHEPVRATATTRPTSGPAARTGTPSARRRTRTARTARSSGSCPRAVPLGSPGVGTTYDIPAGQHVPGRHRPDAARDLRDGLPQPVPDPRRSGDGRHLHGRLRPGRRLDEPDPRPAGLGRVQHRQGAGLLRLALLRPRERPVPRHHLHDNARRGHRQRPLQLRRAGQQLAQQHRPDEPPGGQAGDDVDGLQRDSTCASRTSGAAARRPAAPSTATTRTATRRRSSRASTTASGSSASGTTTGSRPRRGTTTASPPA